MKTLIILQAAPASGGSPSYLLIGVFVAILVLIILLLTKKKNTKTPASEDENGVVRPKNSGKTYTMLKIGIFIAILGIAGIIVSQTTHFTKQVFVHNYMLGDNAGVYADVPDPELKNQVLYTGIAVLVLGAGIALFSSNEKN